LECWLLKVCARINMLTKVATSVSNASLQFTDEHLERTEDVKGQAIAALISLMLSGATLATELQVQVRVNVQHGCVLLGQTRDAGPQQLGVLDFGSAARLDDPTGPLSAQLPGSRLPRLECNPDTAYQVQVDGGQHGGVGDVRYLAAEGANLIPYRIYSDPARRVPFVVNQPLSGRVPATGTIELPLYARIEPLAQVPRAGQYTDLLKVTVTW